MKKARWIVVLVAITALLCTSVAYAGPGNSKAAKNKNGKAPVKVNISQDKGNSEKQNQANKQQGFGPGESAKELKAQIRERTRTIKKNEAKCNELKRQIKRKCMEMKKCINQQQNQEQETAQINEEQAAKIQEAAALLKENNTKLKSERCQYKRQMAQMNRNKRAGDKTALCEDLDAIIVAQEERITALDQTLETLDELNDTINAMFEQQEQEQEQEQQ